MRTKTVLCLLAFTWLTTYAQIPATLSAPANDKQAVATKTIESVRKIDPKAIKDKGISPEQAEIAKQSAEEFKRRAPRNNTNLGPEANQQFLFVMPQGTRLGYKHGVHYVEGYNGTIKMLAEDATANMTARFNGALVGGKFHTISGDLSWIEYGLAIVRDHVYSPGNNWQLYQSVERNQATYLISQETAVDPVTQRVYGTFLNDDYVTYDIAWVDYDAAEIHRIGPARRDYPGLGMNSEGRLFGVDMDGVLYEISLEDGSDRVIGRTGISVRDEDDRYYYQCAECGIRDNLLYWMAVLPDGSSALYAISLEDASAQKICDLPKYTLAHCLTIPNNAAVDGAPDAVSNLKASFNETETSGTLSFNMPATTFDGQQLTSANYQVRIDGKQHAEGVADAGNTVSLDVTLEQGLHYIEAYAYNSVGRSPQASTMAYVGKDTPGVVAEPTLTIDGNKANITWGEAAGAHGGYAGNISYRVASYPDWAVHSNITGTSYNEDIELDEWQRYYYGIQATNGGQRGTETFTNSVAAGIPYQVPYIEDFLAEEDFVNNYTVVDANGDEVSWITNIGTYADFAIYTYNISSRWTNVSADDWLFTPTFDLKAGRTYVLTLNERSLSANKVEIKLGKGANINAMTTTLSPVTEYNNKETFDDVSNEFTVNEDGAYNIGFHIVSDARKSDFILDQIILSEKVTAESPDTVTNIVMTPGDKGALSATISFKAPTTTVGGSTLASLQSIKVMSKNKVLRTFDNPQPGQELSFTDNKASNGFNTYIVVATNDMGDSQMAQVSGFVGIDIPAFDYTSVGVEDGGSYIRVKWDQVSSVGLNGGYVDTSDVAYGVYEVEYDIESGSMSMGDYINAVVGQDHLDINKRTDEGDQTVVSYAIVAGNRAGYDENHVGATYGMPIGQPYTLPFIQSASNGKIGSRMMWAETDNNFSATYSFSNDSYDNDNGSFEWAPSDRTYTLALNTGKISLAGANNPTLRFAHKGSPKARIQLDVTVQTPDREETEILSVNYQNITGDEAQWILENVDLSDFRHEEYVVVKFHFSTNASTNASINGKSVLIDAINVLDSQPYNLSIDIEAPEEIIAGRGDDIDIVVHNVGENPASNYNVKLFVGNNELYSESVDETLAPFGRKVISVNYKPSVFGKDSHATARAELTWLYDLVDEDNEMEDVINIIAPTVRSPREAVATQNDGGQLLSWSAPEQELETVTESFEGPDFNDFDLCGITMEQREGMMGEWTIYNLDGDGTWNGPHGPTGHLPGYASTELEGVDFPNIQQVCAWMVFNIDKVTGTMPVTPHSGKKMAATFDDYVAQDTWLISPELSGNEQTVTFYAAAPIEIGTNIITGETEVGYPEIIEVLTSDKGTDPNDFESLGTDTIQSQGWITYEMDIDKGTKYFAIRNVSSGYNALALFVDDVTFERMSPLPVSYNIYADEVLVGSVAQGEPFQVDGRASQYAVTAVYLNGDESLPVFFAKDGIINVTAQTAADTIYDLSGRRVLRPTAKGVYIVNGKKTVIK